MKVTKSAAVAVGLVALASPAFAQVKATGVWCRAAPSAAPAAACYATFTAPTDDRLVAVESAAGARSEIHTMSLDGGIMRMRKLPDGLALPKGKAVVLKPGAEHLMIIGPKQPFTAGSSVELKLKFAKAAPLSLRAPVKTVAP